MGPARMFTESLTPRPELENYRCAGLMVTGFGVVCS
jgi:hypothetical protein